MWAMRHFSSVLAGAFIMAMLLGRYGPASARGLGADIGGSELLMELAQVGPGPEAPGIYAWTSEGRLERIITFGRHPRWAPGHTRFAYQVGRETWIADVQAHRTTVLDDVVSYLDSPPQVVSGYPMPAMQWGPREDFLVRWLDGTLAVETGPLRGYPVPVPARLWLDRRLDLEPCLVPEPTTAIGNLSISPQGRVAFESLELHEDLGARNREVFIYDPVTRQRKPVSVPWPEVTTLLNPLWDRSGRRLSVDCLTKDGKRFLGLLDTDSGSACRFPPDSQHAIGWMRGLSWSPTDDLVLALASDDGGRSGLVEAVLLKATPGKAPGRVLGIGGQFYTYQGCWSPGGSAVALMQGGDSDIGASRRVGVVVAEVVGASQGEVQEVPIPEHLRPVAIDW